MASYFFNSRSLLISKSTLLMIAMMIMKVTSLKLNCRYKIVEDKEGFWPYHEVEGFYECKATIGLFGDPREIENVAGNHLENKSFTDVKIFTLMDHKNLTRIPLGLNKFFPNIVSINMMRNGFTTIQRGDFDELRNAVYVNLPEGSFQTFGNYAFGDRSKEIVMISLSGCRRLKHIGLNVFQNFDSLTLGVNEKGKWSPNHKEALEIMMDLAKRYPPSKEMIQQIKNNRSN
jgi:hypothetical protein